MDKSRSVIWCHNLFSFLKNHSDFAGQFMGHIFFYLLTHYKWLKGRMVANITEQKIIAVLREIVATYCPDSPILSIFSMSPQFTR